MDRTPRAVADRLGTSRTRVVRAAQRLGVGSRTAGGHWRFSAADGARLETTLGREPAPRPAEFSRIEVRVLAALQHAPRGALSSRGVARRAGTSPTATSRALDRLTAGGLVERKVVTVAEGTARERSLWRLNHRNAKWPNLAAVLASVAVPRRTPARASRVPEHLAHLFWNMSLSELDVDRDAVYIARRILDSDDLDALAWGTRHLPTTAWAEVSGQRGLAPNRRALARNLASSPIAA